MKKFFEDFKAFALKGNIMDMAVGVVVGGAFGKIVTSLVNDIITPLIGIATGGVNFTAMKHVFSPAVLDEAGNVLVAENALLYGNFIQTVIDFFIIALSIFLVLRLMMKGKEKLESLAKKKEEEAVVEEAPAETEVTLLKEIRDMLKEQNK